MQPGTISSWVAVGISVGVIIGGQVVLWVKFKAKVDGKFVAYDEHLKRHAHRHDKQDACIAGIKKTARDYITLPELERFQNSCRSEVFGKIERIERDVDGTKQDIKAMAEDIGETKSMVAQLLALQNGKVS